MKPSSVALTYEEAVVSLCVRHHAPAGLAEDYVERRLPIREIERELVELAERRANRRTA